MDYVKFTFIFNSQSQLCFLIGWVFKLLPRNHI